MNPEAVILGASLTVAYILTLIAISRLNDKLIGEE